MSSVESLDPSTIAMLKESRADEFKMLVDTYIEDSSSTLQTVRQGFVVQDAETIRLGAHSIKGSSANLGAAALAAICQQLETQSGGNDLSNAEILIAQIEEEFARVKVMLLENI